MVVEVVGVAVVEAAGEAEVGAAVDFAQMALAGVVLVAESPVVLLVQGSLHLGPLALVAALPVRDSFLSLGRSL